MKRVAAQLGVVMLLLMWVVAPAYAQVGERPRDSNRTEDAEEAIEDAQDADDEAEAAQYYQVALTAAEAEIAERPNNPLGHRLAAIAALGLKQYAAAGQHFDRATELYPLYEFEQQPVREEAWILLYQQAAPMIQSGEYEAAAVIFEDAHAIYAGRPEVMITLAQIYGQTGDYDRSIYFMDEVGTFMSSETATSADEAALAGWQEQASVIPELRAQVLSAAGRTDEAVAAYRELAEANPDNLAYTRGLASLLMDSGSTSEALAVYEDLMDQPGLSGVEYYAIGVGFYQASDYERAARAFSGAVELNARDRDALEMWARSLQLDSAYADIPAVTQQWVEIDPNSQNALLILAQAANVLEDQALTQQAIQGVEALEVNVDQMQAQRFPNGGAIVSGSVVNKTLEAGTSVTLRFTFFGTSGDEVGTTTATVTVGEAAMAEFFDTEFSSPELVGGYSYELTVG